MLKEKLHRSKQFELKGRALFITSKNEEETDFLKTLEEQGLVVRAIADYAIAKKEIENDLPDILLLSSEDSILAIRELCRELKSTSLSNHIPIVVIGQELGNAEKIECLEIGINDFISLHSIEGLLRLKNLLHLSYSSREERQEKAEESLLTSNEKQDKRLYLNAEIGVLYCSTEGTIKEINEFSLKRLNKSKAEIVGESIFELFPREVDLIKERIQLVIESGSSHQYED